MRFNRRIRRERGVALLAALILMLALVLTLGNIFYRHQIDVARVTRMVHGDQAFMLALSAETWAAGMLADDRDDRAFDSLEENWAQPVPLLPVEDGFLTGCMVDLQGRVNLAGFSVYDRERWEAELGTGDESTAGNGLLTTWFNLLLLVDLPATEEYAATLIDWTDPDTETINQWGAEQNDYAAARAALMVPNRPLTDIGELAVIRAYDTSMVQRLRPSVATLPQPTPININTASELVLTAMGGDRGRDFASFVLEQRPFYSIASFHERLAEYLGISAEMAGDLWPEDLASVTSDYFHLHMRVSLGEVELAIDSLLSRSGRDEAVVLRREVRTIPRLLPDAGTDDDYSEEQFCVAQSPNS